MSALQRLQLGRALPFESSGPLGIFGFSEEGDKKQGKEIIRGNIFTREGTSSCSQRQRLRIHLEAEMSQGPKKASDAKRKPWMAGRPGDGGQGTPAARLTEHNQPGVGVRGAQRVLRRAAVHGAVQLRWHALQDQLLPIVFSTSVQEPAPNAGPREHGFGEDFVLQNKIQENQPMVQEISSIAPRSPREGVKKVTRLSSEKKSKRPTELELKSGKRHGPCLITNLSIC